MLNKSFEPIAINPNITVRKTEWVQVCPNCQNERILGYPQAWNIKKGNSIKECKPCAIELGIIKINKKGLKEGNKSVNSRTTGKKLKGKSIQCELQHLFNSHNKSIIVREKFRKAKLGKYKELANNWQGGVENNQRKIEMSRDEYKAWRKSIFARDNYTCQICLIRGGNLEADHIKEWCNYPELRYELSNGRTLCKNCHKTTNNYGNKAKRKK